MSIFSGYGPRDVTVSFHGTNTVNSEVLRGTLPSLVFLPEDRYPVVDLDVTLQLSVDSLYHACRYIIDELLIGNPVDPDDWSFTITASGFDSSGSNIEIYNPI